MCLRRCTARCPLRFRRAIDFGFYKPGDVLPEKATLLNTGKALSARVELMPWNVGNFNHETLHVWGIPADELANECIVLRLDFAPGVLDTK